MLEDGRPKPHRRSQSNSTSWSHRSFKQSCFFFGTYESYEPVLSMSIDCESIFILNPMGICSAGLSHIFEGRACCELEVMRSLLERRGTRAEFGRKSCAVTWCWWVKDATRLWIRVLWDWCVANDGSWPLTWEIWETMPLLLKVPWGRCKRGHIYNFQHLLW